VTQPRFQGQGVTIDALDVLCAQLTRDLFAIAKFLVVRDTVVQVRTMICGWLARLLRMSRPGKSETTAVKRGVERRLILGSVRGRQSRSLLANVLNESDLHLRYRSSHTQPGSHTNAQHRPSTSAAGMTVSALRYYSCCNK